MKSKNHLPLIISVLLFICPMVHASKPQLANETIDSILQWMYDNVEIDTTHAHQVGLMGLQKAYEDGNEIMIGDFHDIIAYWHDYHQKFQYYSDSIVFHYTKSLEAYKQTDSLHFIPSAQLDLATAYMNHDQVEKARALTFKAVALLEKDGDKADLADAYNSLANLHWLTDEPAECVKYAKQSWSEFAELNNHLNQVNSSIALMECLCRVEDFETAHKIGLQSIELTREHFPSQLGYVVRSLERMSRASIGLGLIDRGVDEAEELWEIAENAVGAVQAAGHKVPVGDAYFAKGKFKEALEVFEFVDLHTNDDIEKWEMNQKMAICYSKLNQFDKAFQEQQNAFERRGQMLDDKVAKLKSESFVKYETGKKDQVLASQELQLEQKTKIQTLSYGVGSLLLLMLSGLLYFFRKNKSFTQSLQEKNDENELLLKEIHHRVKNNLQTVSALLTLQSSKLESEQAKTAMLASQNRVNAMGLLHQKLYQGKHLGAIEMKEYFLNLSEGVLDSFNKEDKVNIELVMDQLELDIDTAVPIGLIVNELMTNALKYAFPSDYQARIKIKLKEINQDQLFLEVSDNGIGFTEQDGPEGTGFGTQLVNLLTKQLRGEIDRTVDNGTIISLTLKKSKAA